jgi:hypothetical protein
MGKLKMHAPNVNSVKYREKGHIYLIDTRMQNIHGLSIINDFNYNIISSHCGKINTLIRKGLNIKVLDKSHVKFIF